MAKEVKFSSNRMKYQYDLSKAVFECLRCGRKVIAESKPEVCEQCGNEGHIVLNLNYKVMK